MDLLYLLFSFSAFVCVTTDPVDINDPTFKDIVFDGENLYDTIVKAFNGPPRAPSSSNPGIAHSRDPVLNERVSLSGLQDEQNALALHLTERFTLYFRRVLDFFMKKVSIKLGEFGSYRFRTAEGETYLVNGLGQFNSIGPEGIKISDSVVDGKRTVTAEIVIGPITFLSDSSDGMPIELLPRTYTIAANLEVSANNKEIKIARLEKLQIEDKVKESNGLRSQQLSLLKKFFDSLERTDYRQQVVKIMDSVILTDFTREVLNVLPLG